MAKKYLKQFSLSVSSIKYEYVKAKGHNKFFDGSKANQTKNEFNNPYFAKKFEKIKFRDLVKMV